MVIVDIPAMKKIPDSAGDAFPLNFQFIRNMPDFMFFTNRQFR
jgi:hypothetical protein